MANGYTNACHINYLKVQRPDKDNRLQSQTRLSAKPNQILGSTPNLVLRLEYVQLKDDIFDLVSEHWTRLMKFVFQDLAVLDELV